VTAFSEISRRFTLPDDLHKTKACLRFRQNFRTSIMASRLAWEGLKRSTPQNEEKAAENLGFI
jgi:hypothetical protein